MALTKVTYSMIEGAPINVLDYGAVGNGVADDSAALNAAATAAAGSALYIPSGTYKIKAVNISSDTTVICDVNTVFTPADTTTKDATNYLIQLDGDNISWTGGKIEGEVYTILGSNPSPYYGMLISKTTGDNHAANVKIDGLYVEGCLQAIWAVSTDECTVQNITIDSPYQWGLAFPAPRTKKLIVDNVRVYNTGINEGIKIASLYQQTGDATSDIILSNLDVQNCGALNPAAGQNGIDLFISAATRLHINNFNIVNSGASGIELKRNAATSITPNEYKEIVIQNGIITSDKEDSGGISLNVTAPYPTTSAGTGKVIISNVQFNYVGSAAPTGVSGIAMSAWNDVLITGCQFNGDFTRYINPSAASALTDKTIANLVVSGCVGYGGQSGIVVGNSLSNAKFINNVLETTDDVFVFSSSSTSTNILIQGGYYKTSGTGALGINAGSATLTNLVVENSNFYSDSYCVSVQTSATIRNNSLTSVSSDAVRLASGTCLYYNNNVSVPSSDRSHIVVAGTMTSYNNNLGSATSAPTKAAARGDIVYNSAPTSGGNFGWICTTAGGSGVAVWKTYGAIA